MRPVSFDEFDALDDFSPKFDVAINGDSNEKVELLRDLDVCNLLPMHVGFLVLGCTRQVF